MAYYDNLAHGMGNMNVNGSPSPQAYYPHQDYGHGQGSPPAQPQYQPPADKPPLPQGWTPLFDHQHQQWYYVEQATGQSQWEVPGYNAGLPPHDPNSGYASPPPNDQYGQRYADETAPNKSGSGMGGILLGAAGGAVGGAVLGQVVDHYRHDDDDDSNDGGDQRRYSYGDDDNRGATVINNYYSYPEEQQVPPAVLPGRDADGDSVSSSDREDVEDARDRYEEALRDAESSSASSSDREEVEEAREEYYEEYEDTYGGDDDYGDDYDSDD